MVPVPIIAIFICYSLLYFVVMYDVSGNNL